MKAAAIRETFKQEYPQVFGPEIVLKDPLGYDEYRFKAGNWMDFFADLVIFDEHFHGIEIKGQGDSLRRFTDKNTRKFKDMNQREGYEFQFDTCWLLKDHSLMKHDFKLPEKWGLVIVYPDHFHVVQKPVVQLASNEAIAELLWKTELAKELRRLKMKTWGSKDSFVKAVATEYREDPLGLRKVVKEFLLHRPRLNDKTPFKQP